MTIAMTQNAFDQPHCCIKHHSMPLNGNQAQQRSYYMGYSTPAFISSNRKTSKKIKIRKWRTEWIPPLERGKKKKKRKIEIARGYMISYQYPSKQHSFAWNHNTFSFHPEHTASGVCHPKNHKPKPWKSHVFGKLMPLLAAGMAQLNSSGLFSKVVWLLKPDTCDRSLWDGCGSGGWTSRDKSTSCGWGFPDQAGRDSYPLGRQTLRRIAYQD